MAAAGAWGVWQYQWKWAEIPMPEATATVGEEMPPDKLGELLQKKNKVRDAATFAAAARRIGLTQIAPGIYKLPASAGPLQLAQLFARPPQLVKVTFPEGWTARHMAERLKENKFAAAHDFLRKVYPADQAISPWEGRLFPDTYLLSQDAGADEIIQLLHDRFAEEVKALPQPFPQVQPGKVLSIAQITTLASLVERETAVPSERAVIAGVLLNRLRRGMRLQCDATVQYARELAAARGQLDSGHKNRLLLRDLKIDSPYNTYRHNGLPPGPICNPGAASLQAAARPKNSNYLFYVWSPQRQRHLFATTYEQHLHNIRQVRQEKAPVKTGN